MKSNQLIENENENDIRKFGKKKNNTHKNNYFIILLTFFLMSCIFILIFYLINLNYKNNSYDSIEKNS